MADIAEMAWLKERLPSGIVPKNMDKFEISLNAENKVSILLSASDTLVDGKAICRIKSVILKRKTGSYPKNEMDGKTVLTLSHGDLSLYENTPFVDITAESGKDYFYQAFLVSEGGAVNRCIDNQRVISVGDVPSLMKLFRAECREGLYVALYMDIDDIRAENGVSTNSVVIRRKEGSCPDSPGDGELVTKLMSGTLHNYADSPFLDYVGTLGHYYYRAFPMNDTDVFSLGDANTADIETGAVPPDPYLFEISSNADGSTNIFFDVADSIFENGVKIGDVKKATVVRNYSRFPISASDGTVIVELLKRNLHAYKETPYLDDTVDSASLCYYVLFVESTDGRVNASARKRMQMAGYEVLGFRIKKSESDPYARVEYTNGCEGYAPLKFDTISWKTNYGSWNGSWILNAFRPVMLRYDGTVAYALNKKDQAKRDDGGFSDISDPVFSGNAMLEISRIYMKCWEDSEYEYVQFSPFKLDDGFVALAHMKDGGATELEKIYVSLYEAVMIDGKFRSIAGKRPATDLTLSEMIAAAELNGPNWSIMDFSTYKLLENVLILLGKSTDFQAVYGNGHADYADSVENLALSGTFMSSGPFDGVSLGPSKILWVENLYGNTNIRVLGCVTDEDGVLHIRPYPPYSDILDSDWASLITPKNMNGYQSAHMMTKFGLIPVSDEGSTTTYVPDRIVTGNSGYACIGGSCISGLRNVGMSCLDLSIPKDTKHWSIGTFLTYK